MQETHQDNTLDDLTKCTVAIQQAGGSSRGKVLGTGVIVTEDGLILTCFHVIGVWSAKVPKSKLMLIAAFFNSSINLLQTLLSRAETEGSFMDLSEYILLDFYVPDFETLSQKDGDTIIQAFEMISKRPLSSLLDQIKQKDSDRFALDKTWLQALNYPGNIDKVLNWLYDPLTDEIETLKTMMAEGHIEESTN